MDLETLAAQVGERLLRRGFMLVTAESCTGGWVSQSITSVSGSSQWFDRGFVTYSNAAKVELLGVSPTALDQYGAVSEPVVRAMAEGALRHSHAQVAVAVSGIAGPGGGSLEKPVGTVYLAWAGNGMETRSHSQLFMGNREAVRSQAVAAVLDGLLDLLRDPP